MQITLGIARVRFRLYDLRDSLSLVTRTDESNIKVISRGLLCP
jgi:hypothetical protein